MMGVFRGLPEKRHGFKISDMEVQEYTVRENFIYVSFEKGVNKWFC